MKKTFTIKNVHIDELTLIYEQPEHVGLYLLRNINSKADYIKQHTKDRYTYASKEDVSNYIKSLSDSDKKLLELASVILEQHQKRLTNILKNKYNK